MTVAGELIDFLNFESVESLVSLHFMLVVELESTVRADVALVLNGENMIVKPIELGQRLSLHELFGILLIG